MAKAHVESIDAIRDFKVALIKFAQAASVSLSDAESELNRTQTWLETEQMTFWAGQIRKRQELVARAKDAVRQKKLFKDASGRFPSAVDEEKALSIAMRRLAEAEEKFTNTKKWARRLQRESDLYKGSVQRFATTLTGEVPVTVSKLERLVRALEAYIALNPTAELPATLEGLLAEQEAPVAAGPEMPASPLISLRQLTPRTDLRSGAAIAAISDAPWKIGLITSVQRELTLEFVGRAVQPQLNKPILAEDLPQFVKGEEMIVVATNIAGLPRIYMERLPAAFTNDSGWCARSTEPGDAAYQLVKVAQLLETRPDFACVLALPAGYLVVLDEHGIEALLDPRSVNIWPIQSEPE